jgi:hypothetical protein
MRLYYMTSERWGSCDLARKYLKFSRFDELNNPFELLSAHLRERSARLFYNSLKRAVAEREPQRLKHELNQTRTGQDRHDDEV